MIESKMEMIKNDESAIKNKKRTNWKEHVQDAGNIIKDGI